MNGLTGSLNRRLDEIFLATGYGLKAKGRRKVKVLDGSKIISRVGKLPYSTKKQIAVVVEVFGKEAVSKVLSDRFSGDKIKLALLEFDELVNMAKTPVRDR